MGKLNKTQKVQKVQKVMYLDIKMRGLKQKSVKNNVETSIENNETFKEKTTKKHVEKNGQKNNVETDEKNSEKNSEKNGENKGIKREVTKLVETIPKLSDVRKSNEKSNVYKNYNRVQSPQEIADFVKGQNDMLKIIEEGYKKDHELISKEKENGDLALNGLEKCVGYTSRQLKVQEDILRKINDIKKKTDEIIKS